MSYVILSLLIRQKLELFRTFMKSHEYCERTIADYSTYVSKFLSSSYFNSETPDLKFQIDEYLKNEAVQAPRTFNYSRAAQRIFFQMETDTPYPRGNVQSKNEEIELLLLSFRNHLLAIKHLEEATINSEVNHVRRFLEYTYEKYIKKFDVLNLDANDIRLFFVEEIPQLKSGSKGRMATAIRNFFRYLKFSGRDVSDSIFKLPLSPAVWKQASLPTILGDDKVSALETALDQSKPAGIRNYAIVTCFTELGLRCIEVANLSLDDFSWHETTISIKNTKTHVDRKLPISVKVGKAVTNYLKFSRPQTSNGTLFVRFSHTKGNSMGRAQIRNVIRSAYSKIGISKKITGTHILRKTVACRIYNKGNSLKMVADILGHKSLDSTVVYAKINKEQLSQAADVWPGGNSYDN